MTDYVHLIGAEQVADAGHNMARAAEQMKSAASSMDGSMEMFIRRFEDLVLRFEAAAEKIAPTTVDTTSLCIDCPGGQKCCRYGP